MLVAKISNLVGITEGISGLDLYYKFGSSTMFFLLVSQIVLFLPAILYVIRNFEYFKTNLRIRKLKIKTYLLVIVFGMFFIPIISFVNSISMLFTENAMAESITGMLQETSLVASLIVIAGVPCFLEEIAYRGIFYNEYSRINPVKAIILSSLLFGFLHMNFNQFMYAVVGGVVFALVVEATGSITASMIMHFMINGSSVFVAYLSTKLMSNEEIAQMATTDLNTVENAQEFTGSLAFLNGLSAMQQTVVLLGVFAVFCTVIEIVLFIQIALSEGRLDYVKSLFDKNKNDENKGVKFITPALIVAIVICFAIMLLSQFGVIS